MNRLKTLPVLGFLFRYPQLIAAAAVFVGLTYVESFFQAAGALLYGPALVFAALLTGVFARHFFYRETVDRDAAEGLFTEFWRRLEPQQRVDRAIVVFIAFFLGACHVFASLAK